MSDVETSEQPKLIVVSGPPGAGKTTLAKAIARDIPCPAVIRDEIREGLVHSRGEGAMPSDDFAKLANEAFFGVIEDLVGFGVTLVAEAAFQHKLWAPNLEPLREKAHVRVIVCEVGAATARDRIVHRMRDPARQIAHPDAQLLSRIDRGEYSFAEYQPLRLDAPKLMVDTSDGYRPAVEAIVEFARS